MQSKYGQITIGYGTSEERVLEIESFINAHYVDGRIASVLQDSDGIINIVIRNPPDSGRAPQQEMRLSVESFLALTGTMTIFIHASGWDVEKLLSDSLEKNSVEYEISDNLKRV